MCFSLKYDSNLRCLFACVCMCPGLRSPLFRQKLTKPLLMAIRAQMIKIFCEWTLEISILYC